MYSKNTFKYTHNTLPNISVYSVFYLAFRIQCILVCISEVLHGIYLEYIRIHFALLEYIYSTEYTAIYCIIYLKIYVITNVQILITNVPAPWEDLGSEGGERKRESTEGKRGKDRLSSSNED